MDTYSNILYVKVRSDISLFLFIIINNNWLQTWTDYLYNKVKFFQEMKPELSYLAHHTNSIDKYREETCCVIG